MTDEQSDDSADALSSGVVIVAEHLRLAVGGGIGVYTAGLVDGVARLAEGERPPLSLYASRTRTLPDPLLGFGIPVIASSLPSFLLVRAFSAGFPRVGRGRAVAHATSLMAPPSAAPLTVALHDIAFRAVPEAYPRHGRRWHEAALRRVARHAACCIVPSTATAEAVRAAGVGIADDRMTLIEYGSDHLPEPDDDATAAVLHRLGVEGEFLCAVGTVEPRKNLSRLFAAYGAARPQLPEPWPLVVVGPTGWGPGAGALPAGVVFAGEVAPSVLAGLYRRARLVAYVPLLEGFGLPVVEAMRAGCPVVCSPVPSSKGAGLEVEPTDVEAIQAALVQAASSEELRARLVERGLERALPLTWEATARQHVAVWRRVAEAA